MLKAPPHTLTLARNQLARDAVRLYVARNPGAARGGLEDYSRRSVYAAAQLAEYAWPRTRFGYGYQTNTSGANGEWADTGYSYSGKNHGACFYLVRFDNPTSPQNIPCGYWYNNGGSGPMTGIDRTWYFGRNNATSTWQFQTYDSTAVVTIQNPGTPACNLGQWYRCSASFERGGVMETYVDGARIAQQAASTNALFTTINAGTHIIGNTNPGWENLRMARSTIAACYLWDRPLTPAEHMALHADPWMVFAPERYNKIWPFLLLTPLGEESAVGNADGVVLADKIARRQQIYNRNLTSLRATTPDAQIRELQRAVEDLQRAMDERQSLKLIAGDVEADGLPRNGAYCDLLDAQYIRLQNLTSGDDYVRVEHGLRRTPQGAIFIRQSSMNEVLIEGLPSQDIPPADSDRVFFKLTGNLGELAVALLF